MGLIAAALGAVGGTLADQWKEFFYCEAMPKEVLVTKGVKRIGGRSSNKHGNDNIISNGSGIAVADGQCMIIVEQGKVVEVCAEPGEFTYDTSTEPSIFTGKLGESILETFKTIGKRFAYGGDTGKDQRVYYFNTKEILDNKFGTPNPVPFRVVDAKNDIDFEFSIRCSGVYSYRIADPLLFYTNVSGNVDREYTRDELDTTLRTEFISALAPALAKLSAIGLKPSEVIAHTTELEDAMNDTLPKKWGELRGLKVVSVALGSVTLPPEQAEKFAQVQHDAMLGRNPSTAGGTMINAQADFLRKAGENGGGMNGVIAMNMLNGGGGNVANLFSIGQQQAQQTAAGTPGWTCSCGTVNQGNFCQSCGARRPAGQPLYRCDKCGWTPEDPAHPPKFCQNCGDPFDENDIQK